ncbi:hypothetical protein FHG87_021739 [Trinorchestia longiramus]|nr:hypothetical protein FHG87_021739 [Trinorchestia longiramus]
MTSERPQWEEIDQIVRETPMPPSYHGVCCQVNCRDCNKVRCRDCNKVRCRDCNKVRCRDCNKVRCRDCNKVRCRDCNKDSITLFHIDGLKCKLCGSYNTSRAAGSFLRKKKNTGIVAASHPLADPVSNETVAATLTDFHTSNSSTPSASNLSPTPSNGSSSTPVASNSSPAHSTLSMEVVPAAATSSSPSLVASAMEVFASASSPSTPLTAAMEVVSAASSMSEASSSESEANRLAPRSSSSRGTPGAVTAQEEIHLYEPVSLEELEDDSAVPEEGGIAALIQGLVHGFHDIIGLEDVDDDDDDFSSFLSGDSTPPVVLSVQINGRDAGLDEAEASDWVTEDEADGEFETTNSDSERQS